MRDNTDPAILELLKDEIEAVSKLEHKHVIKQIDHGADTYKKKSGKERKVVYIVLELAT